MKSYVTDFEIKKVRIPLGRVIGDCTCAYDTVDVCVVTIQTNTGQGGVGHGQSMASGRFSRSAWWIRPMIGEMEMIDTVRGTVWPTLEGIDLELLHEDLSDPVTTGYGYLDAAVRMALWDLRAVDRQIPLYVYLGGDASRTQVEAYGSLLDFPIADEDAAALARLYRAMGFRAIKVKIGAEDPGRDLARLRLIRATVGPEIVLTADVNESWTTSTALDRLEMIHASGVDLAYIEDPLERSNFEGLERLATDSPIPIVGHDYFTVYDEFVKAVKIGAYRALRPGPDFTLSRKVSSLADQYDLPLIFGNSLLEVNVHSAVACARTERLEYSHLAWFSLVENPVVFNDGFAFVPKRPGHGLHLKKSVLKSCSMPEPSHLNLEANI